MPPVSKKKAKTSNNIKQEIPQYIISNKEKLEKEGGIEYELKEVWFPPGRIGPLHPGSKFKECNDGWYQVYNEVGEKMWYRVGEKIIKEVFGAEANATI